MVIQCGRGELWEMPKWPFCAPNQAAMHKQGTIQRWDNARGFGFIRSPHTTADIFFHAKDCQGLWSPRLGASVLFEEITVGGKGPRAMAVRPYSGENAPQAGTAPARRNPHTAARSGARAAPHGTVGSPVSFALLCLAWLGLLAWGAGSQRLPLWVLGAALGLNLLTFFVYWVDKHAAQTGQWRTKEDTLHLFSLLGGWPGAGVAQSILRHKSRKASFQATYWATVLAHGAGLLAWLFWLQPKMLLNQ